MNRLDGFTEREKVYIIAAIIIEFENHILLII